MGSLARRLAACVGFEWDEGNAGKNWHTHDVADGEGEEIFFNQPLIVAADLEHSATEQRGYALGQTNQGRLLFIAFIVRESTAGELRIRIISARDMTERERRRYGQA